LEGETVQFVEQKALLGSSNAVESALPVISDTISDVLVVYGDDAVLYAEKNRTIIQQLIELHTQMKNAVTLLTITIDNPFGLGRIVRDAQGKITAIVEE